MTNLGGLTVSIDGSRPETQERTWYTYVAEAICTSAWRRLGAAIGVGLIGMEASSAVGRNPGASTKILVQSILAIAFAEAIVFYALFLVR